MARDNGIVYQPLNVTDKQTQRRRARLLRALSRLGFTDVQQAAASLDKGVPLSDLRGVGAVLAGTMRAWLEEIEKATP